jgi:preprotein translocase subunit SecD
MRSFKCRSFLIALTSLLSISGSMADGLIVVLSGASADHDQRTGKPVLKLIFAETSREKLRTFGSDNIGQKVEFRVAGDVILTPVLREPLSGGTAQISDNGWTDQTVIDLAQQLSEAPKGEIEIRPLPRSD